AMRAQAIRSLAAYSEQDTPKNILALYRSLNDEEKADAVHTLTARSSYALALLDAMEQGKVAKQDLSAFTVRQMLGLGNKDVTEKVNKVWGVLRHTSEDKLALKAKYKETLTPELNKKADRGNGRQVMKSTC